MKNARTFFVIILQILFSSQFSFGQVLGDLRSCVVTGNWTAVSTWQQWNGSAWIPSVTAYPTSSFTKAVTIQSGHTITVDGSGPYSLKTLNVQVGGKVYCNSGGTNVYLNVTGNINNNGIIGNPGIFDCLAFNFEGTNDTISGTGLFEVSRMRKNTAGNATTNLLIAQNVNLRFGTNSTTQIYNNAANSKFNVTVDAGDTLNLSGDISLTTKGHASIDGTDGNGTGEKGGSFTINGTMLVSGTLYLTTNNTNTLYPAIWNINSGGVLQCGQVVAAASGAAKNYLNIFSGGKLKITGNNSVSATFDYPTFPTVITRQSNGGFNLFSTTNNVYNLYPGDTVEYAATGGQDSLEVLTYSNLKLSPTSTTKNIFGTLNVNNDLIFSNPGGGNNLVCGSNTVNIGGNLYCYYNNSINAGTGKFVFNGFNGTLQNINCTIGSPTFYNVEINSAPGVQMNKGITISNNLNLINGKFNLNALTLTVSNSASTAIQRTSGYIYSENVSNASKVVWSIGATTGAHIIPFGVTAVDYVPFTFDLTSGNAGNVTVATYGTPTLSNFPWPTSPAVNNLNIVSGPNDSNETANRFWYVSPTLVGAPVADLTFSYQSSELPLAPYNNASLLSAYQYDGTTNLWQPATPSQTAAAYYVNSPGISSYGVFALAAITIPLPVELVSFSGEKSGADVKLKWTTLSEINNSYFLLERSTDGINFLPIGKVIGQGSTNKATDYFFTDLQPFTGINYYRLKQVDKNGNHTLSQIITVLFEGTTANEAICFVNNLSHQLLLSLPISSDKFSIKLFDTQGKLVFESAETKSNINPSNIDISSFTSGIYLLNISSSSYFKSFKFLIR